jgi:hypothetical protein
MRDAASGVVELLAENRGLAAWRIGPSQRLLHDLGMDGDDAVDFFAAVQDRFGTDLTGLHERWSAHFGPERLPVRFGAVLLPVAAACGVLAATGSIGAIWGIAAAVVLGVAWRATRRRGPRDRAVPITVAQVVVAVERGAWPRTSGPDAR